jgi:hemerythrin-like domain-containing protein
VKAKLKEFEDQHRELKDLCAVLSGLMRQREMLSNTVFCDLLERFKATVDRHLNEEDREVYQALLRHKDAQAGQLASQFLSSTHELRRLFARYKKEWCNLTPAIEGSRHAEFIRDTEEVFRLLRERMDLETRRLYPMLAAG